MISLKILETKSFMEKIFLSEVFDEFLVSSADIRTITDFKITCTINQKYLNSDEIELLNNRKIVLWKEIKSQAFSIIKGNKTPLEMKIIFSLSEEKITKLLSSNETSITTENINGLFLNILYNNNELNCITGTSLNVFSMDKSLDNIWDESIKKFFKKNEIVFE